MTTTKEEFLADVEAFLERRDMTPTAFGLRFAQSPNFVFDLRKGRAPSVDLVDTIDAKMESYERNR